MIQPTVDRSTIAFVDPSALPSTDDKLSFRDNSPLCRPHPKRVAPALPSRPPAVSRGRRRLGGASAIFSRPLASGRQTIGMRFHAPHHPGNGIGQRNGAETLLGSFFVLEPAAGDG